MTSGAIRVEAEMISPTARALGEGFHDDEIWMWLIPRGRLLRRVLPRYYEALIRHVFIPRGAAWTTGDAAGGALWYPPGTGTLNVREQLSTGLAMLPEGVGSIAKGLRWERLIHDNLPSQPHWRLNSLAVKPSAQRSGMGTTLIDPGLRQADADGIGCYLETQRRSNIPFYRRFGFEEIGELSMPRSPSVWQMWREGTSGIADPR
jgi:ribosomal protein S18 acetylase RimI-like enzyme